MTATLKLKVQTVKESPVGYLTRSISPSDVKDDITFAAYAQQTCGIPMPTGKGWVLLRTKVKEFFNQHPDADYMTLVRLTDWCRTRKRRLAHTHSILAMVRYAWRDGVLPEFDPRDRADAAVEQGIAAALDIEDDPEWRRVLIGSRGLVARRGVLEQWRRKRQSLSSR